MFNQTIEEFVIEYWRRAYIPSQYKTDSKLFERASYKKRAARDILTYIHMHKDLHPMMAIEEYSNLMYTYMQSGGHAVGYFMVAHMTAEDILMRLRADKNQYYLY